MHPIDPVANVCIGKKRKTRCEYPTTAGSCLGCQQRGTTCVSQEFDHGITPFITPSATEAVADANETVASRLTRLESLLQKVVEKVIPEDSGNHRANTRDTGLSEDETLIEDGKITPDFEVSGHNPQNESSLYRAGVCNPTPPKYT